MTPVALAGLMGMAAAALVPAPRAPDKISCVDAHEAAQEFRQRNLLEQSREQLLFCSDPRCPRLVAEECRTLLATIDRAPAQRNTDESNVAQGAHEQDLATVESPLSPPAVTPALPLRTTPPPSQRRTAADVPEVMAPSPRTPSPLDAPSRRPRSAEQRRLPVLTGTLAVVALTSAAYFGWRGLSEAEELGRSCSPDCDPSQVVPLRRQLLIADVSLLAGIGLGALTAWTIWNGRDRETDGTAVASRKRRGEPAAGAGWSLVPRLGSVQVEYGGRF